MVLWCWRPVITKLEFAMLISLTWLVWVPPSPSVVPSVGPVASLASPRLRLPLLSTRSTSDATECSDLGRQAPGRALTWLDMRIGVGQVLRQQRKQVTHSCSELYICTPPLRSAMQVVLPARTALSRQFVANSPRLRTVRLPRPSIQRGILAVHSTEQSLFTTTRRGGSSSNAWHRPVTDLPQRMWQVKAVRAACSPISIPVGGLLWRAVHSRRHCVLQGYLAHLSKHPLTTKAVTAWFGACLGDLLAQACAGGPFDLARNVRLGLFALCAGGPVGHYWHRFLDR